jgi:hypothetical protein
VCLDRSRHQCRILQRCGADEDSRCACVEDRVDGLAVAQATGDLHPYPLSRLPKSGGPRQDRGDGRPLVAPACQGAVEVDDVHPSRTSIGESREHRHGVFGIDLLPREIPLSKSNDASSAEVDGRINRER